MYAVKTLYKTSNITFTVLFRGVKLVYNIKTTLITKVLA